jgi:glycosyltransferase involved in cell wall biosynthesis
MNLSNGSSIQISVIVPVYNEQRFLDACIDRLVSQQFPENAFKIIMVDNNSTDVSTQIISNYNRILLLREEKHGSYAAHNRGIADYRN